MFKNSTLYQNPIFKNFSTLLNNQSNSYFGWQQEYLSHPDKMMYKISENLFRAQQQWFDDSLQLCDWQQYTCYNHLQNTIKATNHGMELMFSPSTFYRYLRLNWKKPLENISTQIITTNKLYSQMLTHWLNAFQLSSTSGQEEQSH